MRRRKLKGPFLLPWIFGATFFSIFLQEDPLHMKERSENALLAFTWWHFMKYTKEPEYIAFLPMVKVFIANFIRPLYII